jgi:hypothetical protein
MAELKCFRNDRMCNRESIKKDDKLCFIACPDPKQISLELDLIKKYLEERGIKPYIAVQESALNQDVFCSKICPQIQDSLFCVVILNNVKRGGDSLEPSPNVYYEYGFMTGVGKYVIPIQKEGHKLEFNVQSLDGVKYTEENFTQKITRAIDVALKEVEKSKKSFVNYDKLKVVKQEIAQEDGDFKKFYGRVSDYLSYNNIEINYRIDFRKDIGNIIEEIDPDHYCSICTRQDRIVFKMLFSPEVTDNDVLVKIKLLTKNIREAISGIEYKIAESDEDEELNEFLESLKHAEIMIIKYNLYDIKNLYTRYAFESKKKYIPLSLFVINTRYLLRNI